MGQVVRSLLHTQNAWTEFLACGYVLASYCITAFGEQASRWETPLS